VAESNATVPLAEAEGVSTVHCSMDGVVDSENVKLEKEVYISERGLLDCPSISIIAQYDVQSQKCSTAVAVHLLIRDHRERHRTYSTYS
jgi:hypothetical protein